MRRIGWILLVVTAMAAGCGDDETSWTQGGCVGSPAAGGTVDDGLRVWTDAAGCAVGVDVIAHQGGPAECGWELIQVLTVGTPLGAPITAESARTYLWDPVGFLPYVDGESRNTIVKVADLPPGVVDSGFRRGDAELWHDPADGAVLYIVEGLRGEQFELHTAAPLSCE